MYTGVAYEIGIGGSDVDEPEMSGFVASEIGGGPDDRLGHVGEIDGCENVFHEAPFVRSLIVKLTQGGFMASSI